jgi:hypothetical protein
MTALGARHSSAAQAHARALLGNRVEDGSRIYFPGKKKMSDNTSP